MQRIEVSGKVFKDIREQIERQTERKCKNCTFEKECETDFVEFCKGVFEQKPINIILPEDVLKEKCPKLNKEGCCDSRLSKVKCRCDTSNENTCEKIEIPLNESLEIVCGECEGKGKLEKHLFYEDHPTKIDEYKIKDCPSCSGKGSITLIVREKIEFEVQEKHVIGSYRTFRKEGLSIHQACEKCEFIESQLRKDIEDGNYVLLKVELVKSVIKLW
jgi:hypothetical protein